MWKKGEKIVQNVLSVRYGSHVSLERLFLSLRLFRVSN